MTSAPLSNVSPRRRRKSPPPPFVHYSPGSISVLHTDRGASPEAAVNLSWGNVGTDSASTIQGEPDDTQTVLGGSGASLNNTTVQFTALPLENKTTNENIRIQEDTEFHKCITAKDWEFLSKNLAKFDSAYYKRKREQIKRRGERLLLQQQRHDTSSISPKSGKHEPRDERPVSSVSPRQSIRTLFFPHSNSTRNLNQNQVDPATVSPLLKVDEMGRTPLHKAFLYGCPENIVLDLLRAERLAASQADDLGQLPLHLAVESRQHDHVLRKVIKAHPNALKTKDKQGQTPVGLAVRLARKLQESLPSAEDEKFPFHWWSATTYLENNWQMDQFKTWTVIDCLLKDLMHREKCVIPSEHGLVLEALEAGAPPGTINRCISTADKYLLADDDLAGSALALCTERQYPLDTIQYLLENSGKGTMVISDYIGKALVNHYRKGCISGWSDAPAYVKQMLSACKASQNSEMGGCRGDSDKRIVQILSETSQQCREWWEILQFFLFYCALGKDFSEKNLRPIHMVHIALSIPVVPPSLIQLLLVVFPESRVELCPIYHAFPVHLACTRWRYDIIRNDMDASLEKVLKTFLKADKSQIVQRYRGRLPLHMALIAGQSWGFVKPFVGMDAMSLGMRDPQTKLFPFQLAALKISPTNLTSLLRHQCTPNEWRLTTKEQKTEAFNNAEEALDRRQIGTIFELLRSYPRAIEGTFLIRDTLEVVPTIKGAGIVSQHYLTFAYSFSSIGWRINAGNIALLRDSILNGFVAKALVAWYERLRELIWEANPSDSIVQNVDFLLHAALYNPDTPPLVVELLLALFPMAATKPIPQTQIYPLHIAAGTIPYRPQPFEVPSSMDNLHLTLNAYKGAVRFPVNGQLPLHMSLSRGKMWHEIRPLVNQNKKALLIEDPTSGLFPFQIVASFKVSARENSTRYSRLVAIEAESIGLDKLPMEERAKFLRDTRKRHDLQLLSTLFELLRAEPSALHFRVVEPTSDTASDASSVLSSERLVRANTVLGDLDGFLQQSKSISPSVPRNTGKLSSFLQERRSPGACPPPLGRKGSSRSLLSDAAGGIRRVIIPTMYEDNMAPEYDDDAMSSMGASSSSLALMAMSPSPRSGCHRGRWSRKVRSPYKRVIMSSQLEGSEESKPVLPKFPNLADNDNKETRK